MKKHLSIIAFVFAISFAHNGYSQGWVADITVDLNHSLYAFERIEHVNFSFSGYFASGTSASSSIRFILKGSGTPSGGISVTISGTAYQPYDQTSPYSTSVSGNFSGSYTTGCKVGYFTKQGATSNQQVTVIIKIYPRLQITDPVQECERITITTSTC